MPAQVTVERRAKNCQAYDTCANRKGLSSPEVLQPNSLPRFLLSHFVAKNYLCLFCSTLLDFPSGSTEEFQSWARLGFPAWLRQFGQARRHVRHTPLSEPIQYFTSWMGQSYEVMLIHPSLRDYSMSWYMALSLGHPSTYDWCSVNEKDDCHAPAFGEWHQPPHHPTSRHPATVEERPHCPCL